MSPRKVCPQCKAVRSVPKSVNMCFELGENQSITCLTIQSVEVVKADYILRERQKLASKLYKGRGKTESANQALEQVKLVSKLCKAFLRRGFWTSVHSFLDAVVDILVGELRLVNTFLCLMLLK